MTMDEKTTLEKLRKEYRPTMDKEVLHSWAADVVAALSAAAQPGPGVTLRQLQAAHVERQKEWCPDQVPDLSFRGNEMAGEVGEACNVIKKLERERQGWRGSRATKEQLAEELGDVIHTAILCAITAGIDIEPATIAKFNATSEKNGLASRLLPTTQAGKCSETVAGPAADSFLRDNPLPADAPRYDGKAGDLADEIGDRVEALLSEARQGAFIGLHQVRAITEIKNRIRSATPPLPAQGAVERAEPVELEEALRLAEIGEYLYNACAYSYGDGQTEPREYGIEWQWQQSKPGEYGQGQLLAASTKWHAEQAEDGTTTEAAKLRSYFQALDKKPTVEQVAESIWATTFEAICDEPSSTAGGNRP